MNAATLAAALRQLMNYVGGWDLPPTHPCGIGRDTLAAYDAGRSIPEALNTQAALLNVADDYMKDRDASDRDGLEELVNEAIGHACAVLNVNLELPRDEELHDALAEELTDRHTLTTDDSRSDGPRHHFDHH